MPRLHDSLFNEQCQSILRLAAHASGIYKEPLSHFISVLSHQNIEAGIDAHAPYVAALNTAGEKLLNSSSAENTAEIKQDLADLSKR